MKDRADQILRHSIDVACTDVGIFKAFMPPLMSDHTVIARLDLHWLVAAVNQRTDPESPSPNQPSLFLRCKAEVDSGSMFQSRVRTCGETFDTLTEARKHNEDEHRMWSDFEIVSDDELAEYAKMEDQ